MWGLSLPLKHEDDLMDFKITLNIWDNLTLLFWLPGIYFSSVQTWQAYLRCVDFTKDHNCFKETRKESAGQEILQGICLSG